MSDSPRYVILDVDDVLIDTDAAETRARVELGAALADLFDAALSRSIYEEFFRRWDLIVDWQQGALRRGDPRLEEVYGRLCFWQRGVTGAGYEVKFWSRDAMLASALEANGVEPSTRILEHVVSRYWKALAENSKIFADAVTALNGLKRASLRIHLATNSDGNLRFDDRRKILIYEPEAAESAKRSRLRCLADLGFTDGNLTVGDPIGKPDVRFCRKVLGAFSSDIGEEVDLRRTLVLGDSLGSDILPFLELGAARGWWLRRNSAHGRRSLAEAPEKVTVIHSLNELAHL